MKRLAVIPSDALQDYLDIGYGQQWLESYYNPCGFFDEVYLFSPLEKDKVQWLGMKVVHTQEKDLPRRLKEYRIDIVRAYGGNWACRMACDHKQPGVPVVVSVHDRRAQRLYDAISHADIVLCVSQVVRDLVLTKFKTPELAWILPNRVNFKTMRPMTLSEMTKTPKDFSFKHKILFVGRLDEVKNLSTLIKALRHLGQDYGLLVIGQGDRRGYQQLADHEAVQRQCQFIESVKNEDLAQFYSWCDCMCAPSLHEGFPIAITEALACGTIVVTSNIAPMNEFITHLDNGVLIDQYEDPQAIAKLIQQACTDQALRQGIKSKARTSVECFEQSRVDQLEMGYYQNILAMRQEGVFKS